MYVSQSEVATGIAVGERFVVEAEQLQNRGVQIVNVDSVVHRFQLSSRKPQLPTYA
jgi:hypothetical protein